MTRPSESAAGTEGGAPPLATKTTAAAAAAKSEEGAKGRGVRAETKKSWFVLRDFQSIFTATTSQLAEQEEQDTDAWISAGSKS